jgi:EpsI family protein
MDRRDLLAGLACVGALGTAEWLRPRNPLVLMPEGAKLAAVVPEQIGPWARGGDGDIVVPRTEGSLATKLYGDQLARIYFRTDQPALPIMLSVAYGVRQSDGLQLHRPESCYPAIGFSVGPSRPGAISAGAASVPVTALTARIQGRVEDIVYWSRIGRSFPRSAAEQREMRLSDALKGVVPDGALVRASAVRTIPDAPVFGEVESFLRAMIGALGRDGRQALLGAGG